LTACSVFQSRLPFSSSASFQDIYPGEDEKTASGAHYFDWINSQYEGTTEERALVNLEFFKLLYDEYGMKPDVYAAMRIDGKSLGATK